MPVPELNILIKRCLKGDHHAQSSLYRLFVRDLYNLVVRMVPRQMDAEDIVQETFIRVFKNLHTFRGEAELSTWIKRIAINLALQHLKNARRMFFVEVEDHHLPEADDEEEEIDMNRVHHAIKELPEGCRVIFSLYLLEGYRHKEIAEILDISESTSKSQYQRAKTLLRKLLKDGSFRTTNPQKEGCIG